MSFRLFNSQPTQEGRSDGKAAALTNVSVEDAFRSTALKFDDPEDASNYLTSVAKTLARSIGSTWASVYEVAHDVKETEAWRTLRPMVGEPPTSFDDWWSRIFDKPIAEFVLLERRYQLIKEHNPELLKELNYEEACRMVAVLEQKMAANAARYAVVGQEMIDLYGERMEPEVREQLEAKVEQGEKVTQQEVADAAGVTQQSVQEATCKNGQQTENTGNPGKSTREDRRYKALSQIEGMKARIAAGESMRALAVEAGIELPSLCLPRSPQKAAARILADFGNSPDWLKTLSEILLERHLELIHGN